MEKELTIVNDRLTSALSECDTKDELVKKHAKMAQESIKGNFILTPVAVVFFLATFMICTFQKTMRSVKLMFRLKIFL